MATQPCWSVVIPAFNEAKRLPRYLEEVVSYLVTRGEPWEVVVVDDGSTDGTENVAGAIAVRYADVRVMRQPVNSGKGAAVRAGMLTARGTYRLFADADGATPIAELKRLEAVLAAGTDVAIGSRAVLAAGVAVRARRGRVLAGRLFNAFSRRIGLDGIQDSQCGFKAFTAAAATDLFPRMVTNGFAFDVELLLRARARGWRVVEVPVNWQDQPASKVSVLTDGPRMLWQILAVRRRVAREERPRATDASR
jgi:dolichyl-phosphate beta-glucosyltransferase